MTLRSADSGKLAHLCTTIPFLVRDGSKETLHFIEKALQKRQVPRSAEEVTINFLEFPETDTVRKLVSLLKDITKRLANNLTIYSIASLDIFSEIYFQSSNTRKEGINAS